MKLNLKDIEKWLIEIVKRGEEERKLPPKYLISPKDHALLESGEYELLGVGRGEKDYLIVKKFKK